MPVPRWRRGSDEWHYYGAAWDNYESASQLISRLTIVVLRWDLDLRLVTSDSSCIPGFTDLLGNKIDETYWKLRKQKTMLGLPQN